MAKPDNASSPPSEAALPGFTSTVHALSDGRELTSRSRPGRGPALILMTDQQRWDSLGIYGCDWAHTPNLDRLGAEGVVFDACTVNNTVCTPSRASLMTGRHLPGHGVYRLYDDLPEDQVLFTEHLQRHGYRTALFGKLQVSSKDYEHERRHPHDGFDIHEFCMEGGWKWIPRIKPTPAGCANTIPIFTTACAGAGVPGCPSARACRLNCKRRLHPSTTRPAISGF